MPGYGKGFHSKAKLNLADCAAYALAKSLSKKKKMGWFQRWGFVAISKAVSNRSGRIGMPTLPAKTHMKRRGRERSRKALSDQQKTR